MLLKKIKLNNFRQFKNEEMSFSFEDPNKRVTMVKAGNDIGKTAITNAFVWCLYDVNKFDIQTLCNMDSLIEANENDELEVSVTIELMHNNYEYTITREILYIKDTTKKSDKNSGVRIKSKNFKIYRIGEDGNQITVQNPEEELNNKILPKDMHEYFFFSGEKVGNIIEDRKGTEKDFSSAVKSLLGLKAIEKAIKHLASPSARNSVANRFEAEISADGDEQLEKCNNEIKNIQDKILKLDKELEEYKNEISNYNHIIEKAEEKIKQHEEGAKQQEIRELKRKNEKDLLEFRDNSIKEFFSTFNNNSWNFFAYPLLIDAIETLDAGIASERNIPNVNDETIKYLLERGVCLCGTDIKEGGPAYKNILDWLDYVPPKFINNIITEFKKNSEIYTELGKKSKIYETLRSKMSDISDKNSRIETLREEIDRISESLTSQNSLQILSDNELAIISAKKGIEDVALKRENAKIQKGILSEALNRLETERHNLSQTNSKNRISIMGKAYAQEIAKDLGEQLEKSEKEVRKQLEERINKINIEIFDDNRKIELTEKYELRYFLTTHDRNIERSNGAQTSTVLSFIALLIQMLKEKNAENGGVTSEPYPLVIEAPMSTLEKSKIRPMIKLLVENVEQLIIFTKDTEADVMIEEISEMIGNSYEMKRRGTSYTDVVIN